MTVIQVHRDDRRGPHLVQARGRTRRGLPGRVQIPAVLDRIVADVVADGAGRGLRRNLIPAIAESHRARQPVASVRPVAQARQRGRQLHFQPALARMPADRFVPPVLARLAVGGQEQPGRLPLLPPPGFGQPRGGQVRPLAQHSLPAPGHRNRPGRQPPVHPGQPSPQLLQPDRLGVPLGSRRIPAHPPGPAARRGSQPRLDPADAGTQAGLPSAQVPLGRGVLVLAGAGDRPGPPRGRLPGQRPLAPRPRQCPAPGVEPAFRAPRGQVTPGQRPQVRADRPQHRRVGRRHPQPGPHPRPAGPGRRERGDQRAEPAHPPPPHLMPHTCPRTLI
jgi:hypothetical protein